MADVGVIRLYTRKHRAVFLFFSVSEHPPLSLLKVAFVLNLNKDCSEMKIIPINRSVFFVIDIITVLLFRDALILSGFEMGRDVVFTFFWL